MANEQGQKTSAAELGISAHAQRSTARDYLITTHPTRQLDCVTRKKRTSSAICRVVMIC
jgi:hypothetical protein